MHHRYRPYPDIKPDNTMVSLVNADAAIHDYLAQHPSSVYEPRNEPELSPDPIITVKSEPLPAFGLDPTLSNLNIRVIDYGTGQCFVGAALPWLGLNFWAGQLFQWQMVHWKALLNPDFFAHQRRSSVILGQLQSTFGLSDVS